MLLGLGLQGQVSSLQPKGVEVTEVVDEVAVIIKQFPMMHEPGSRMFMASFNTVVIIALFVVVDPLLLIVVVPWTLASLLGNVAMSQYDKRAKRHNKVYKLNI